MPTSLTLGCSAFCSCDPDWLTQTHESWLERRLQHVYMSRLTQNVLTDSKHQKDSFIKFIYKKKNHLYTRRQSLKKWLKWIIQMSSFNNHLSDWFKNCEPFWNITWKTAQMNHLTLEDNVNSMTIRQTDSQPMNHSERFIKNSSNESFNTRRQD